MTLAQELQLLILEQQVDALNKPPRGIETCTLEEAELEEDTACQPIFGWCNTTPQDEGGVLEYLRWFSDKEDCRYETN